MPRRADSVRFAPYFKVQTWDDRALCWIDIQRSYETEAAARAAAPLEVRTRVMRIAPDGRRPLP